MNQIIFSFLAIVIGTQMATATGISMRSTCTSVLTNDGNATILLQTVSMSAPGGPVSSKQTLSIDGKSFARLSAGKYEQGLTMKSVPLQYPSGAVSRSLSFITINPGNALVKAINEGLYYCVPQSGK